ncbi:MAG: tRNA 2-thiocytidine(32) synthetase TtcA [bacterium]|nr:tRNA 2-thiocytidine(32) synthetase TtcA [bacterium]
MAQNLHEFIRKNMELAVNDFQMIQPGDRILVGVSGGADSFTLLKVLSGRKIFIPQDITLIPAYIDLGFAGEDTSHIKALESYFEQNSYEYYIDRTTIGLFAHSEKNRKKPCFLCSRLRRKRLFEIADKFNCKKIALGHHKDDIIETLLINIFFAREIATINPNQPFFKGKYQIIRPLVYVWEKKIKRYAQMNEFPVFENLCPTAKTSHRNIIKNMLHDLERKQKGVKENIFKSLRQVKRDYIWGIIDSE